ncbi:MAG TPA: peroxiredoxin-like family protein [Planctomycetota bacterium]|nr:peroxiredoxin-like family protein [Planctomycetota bacterium]
MDRVSTEFGHVEVLDVEGRPHRLREAWAERACALVFVRHFGCLLCREQVAELRPHLQEIRAAGGDLVVVGTGGPNYAKAFQKDLGILDVELYIDSERRAYDLAGFRRGVTALIHPRAVWNYLRAFFGGHKYKGMQGDALQQGGVLVVAVDGALVFRFASKVSGDHPEVERVVAAVKEATRVAELLNPGH